MECPFSLLDLRLARSLGLSRSIPGQANGWLVPTHTPGSLDPQPRFNH